MFTCTQRSVVHSSKHSTYLVRIPVDVSTRCHWGALLGCMYHSPHTLFPSICWSPASDQRTGGRLGSHKGGQRCKQPRRTFCVPSWHSCQPAYVRIVQSVTWQQAGVTVMHVRRGAGIDSLCMHVCGVWGRLTTTLTSYDSGVHKCVGTDRKAGMH